MNTDRLTDLEEAFVKMCRLQFCDIANVDDVIKGLGVSKEEYHRYRVLWKNLEYKTKRYYVDLRSGCVAVCDSNIEVDSNGLNQDSQHVLAFWMGEKDGQGGYDVPNDVHQQALDLCRKLNDYEDKVK